MGKRLWAALLLACCVGAVSAAGPASVREQVEATLLVKGTIDIGADGGVDGYTIEQQEQLPEGIAGVIDRVVPRWRFEPVHVGGRAARVRAGMNLRLVARKLDNGDFAVQIRDAGFNQESEPGELVIGDQIRPPRYPPDALRTGVSGTVYLALKVGRDGRVEEAMAEQVNLRVVGSERQMRLSRELLAKAALAAARYWTFKTPTTGEHQDDPYWSVRTPVSFEIQGKPVPEDHQWHAYVPGPRQTIPWFTDDDREPSAADALAAGGVYPLNGGPRLLTSLDPT